ncbi:MAG: hypothetical protein ACXVBE_02720 [Bdellovibrionota bacterium]
MILVLGVIACLYFHLRSAAAIPGLHFDEAWAMNYSWHIAFEKGFWPWQAMSPYTAPWAHYWAALWFRFFGASLAVFRGSQIALSLAAVFVLGRELFRLGFGRASAFFPLLVVLVPGLLLNHRFAIELNGFHPLLFALVFCALARGRVGWASAFCVIGSTAHILFYGVGLALIAAAVWEKKEFSFRERKALGASALALAVFFCRVLVEVPEKGKAAALLLSALVLVGISVWPRWVRLFDFIPRWKYLPPVLGAVFFFNLVFFAEGEWSAAIYTGFAYWKSDLGLLFLFPALFGWLAWVELERLPALLRHWFWFGLFFVGVMMLKPAPRYFEIPLLALAALLAFAIARRSARQAWIGTAALSLHAGLIYFTVLPVVPFEAQLQLLFFKDSSRDFLSKQKLVQFLGGAGCGLSDIKSVDSRVREALQALSYGDWPVFGKCPLKDLRVTRSTESPLKTKTIADFVLEGSEADGTKK